MYQPVELKAQFSEAHFETILLRTDAIFVADVDGLSEVKEQGLVEVRLSNPNIVSTRWNGVPPMFRMRGRLDETANVVQFGHHQEIRKNTRYLFFLRGGRWRSTPLIDDYRPNFPISDGIVQCAGGQIFGITSHGLFCSTPERQAGEPLTEDRMVALLRRALERARHHRPEMASSQDTAGRLLELSPSGPMLPWSGR